MKAKQIAVDKVWEISDKADAIDRSKYIEWVMKEEDCNYETAWSLCTRHTDPVEPKYSLGYRMASPAYQMAMNQKNKAKREIAIERFKQMLEPDELELFEKEVLTMDTRKMWEEEKRKQKKEKKQKVKA